MKKPSPGVHTIYKCAKFQHDFAIFEFSRLTQIFRVKRGPKNEDLKKVKILIAGIHPIYNCAKFQHDFSIFGFYFWLFKFLTQNCNKQTQSQQRTKT